jgi:phosphoribosylamine--glycine ligase
LSRDPDVSEVIVAPGNDGIAAAFRCLPIDEARPTDLIEACRREAIDLVVIGPETPLALGVVDALVAAGIATFGPGREAARLESSKWFAKELMRSLGVPTARAECYEDAAAARRGLAEFDPPFVIKADGLAAGKGVCVTESASEAERFIGDCLEHGRFGESGRRVVIEEFLAGEEASVMAICCDDHALLLPPARDYKRARDGDAGPNTGGMGAYAPGDAVDRATEHAIVERIVQPLLAGMRSRGTPYRGVLYCGLMLTDAGPRVVEINVRCGDPETQAVLPLVRGDLAGLMIGVANGVLERERIERESGAAVVVALVDRDYPESSSGAGVIEGLDDLMRDPSLMVFHAGTRRDAGSWRIAGGRGAYVAARADDRKSARHRVYDAIARLGGEGYRYRRDVASAPDRDVARGSMARSGARGE